MNRIVSSLTRAATRGSSPLNILTCPTHESWESNLARTGHQFYAFRHQSVKDWNYAYRSLPNNYTLLNPDKGFAQLPPDIDFDLVFVQNRFGQFQLLKSIADTLQVPLVTIEHTQPHPDWPEHYIHQIRQMRGDVNVFISEYSRKLWGWGEDEAIVIHHGIDTECFSPDEATPRERHCLSVVNDWVNRDVFCGFYFWAEATKDLPVAVLGATPGLSQPASSLKDLADAYRQSQIFVNTSLASPIPTALLEAMASGCCCVSTATAMIPEIIQHGQNGMLATTPSEMREVLVSLLDNPEECRRLGEAARQTIIDRFHLNRFVDDWNKVFEYAAGISKWKA